MNLKNVRINLPKDKYYGKARNKTKTYAIQQVLKGNARLSDGQKNEYVRVVTEITKKGIGEHRRDKYYVNGKKLWVRRYRRF